MRRLFAPFLALLVASFAIALSPGSSVGAASNTVSASATDRVFFQWVTYGDGKFVAVGLSDVSGTTNVTRIFTSTDGSSWTEGVVPTGHRYGGPITYGNGKFVVIPSFPDQRNVLTSTDGLTWTAESNAMEAGYWRSVMYGGPSGREQFVAVGATLSGSSYTRAVMTSPDGITWSLQTVTGQVNGDAWNSVAYANGNYVAVGSNSSGQGAGLVMTSTDAQTWTRATTTADPYWYTVAHGDGRFVAVGPNGASTATKAMVSVDSSISWTETKVVQKNSTDVTSPKSLAFGNNTFVAAMADPTNDPYRVIRFVKTGGAWPDHTDQNLADGGWTAVPAAGVPSDFDAYGLAFGNNTFVAVGNRTSRPSGFQRGLFRSTDDGVTWTAGTVGSDTSGGTTGGTTGGTSGTLAPGQYSATVDGQNVPITVSSESDGQVRVTGTDFSLTFNSPTSGNGNELFLPQGSGVVFEGSGYKPDTNVNSTMTTTKRTTRISRARVSKKGTFATQLTVPGTVRTGKHEIKITGTGQDGKLRSIAVGVRVGKVTQVTVKQFRAYSKQVKPRLRVQARAIMRQNSTATAAHCTGWVKITKSMTKSDVRLAKKRARTTCRALKRQKPSLFVTVSTKTRNNTAREVLVTLR